ncbi:MAG: hypothetical protein A2622_05220 [Bdellovibrionales bacterium RIFCSPHIGHO2_01_FULL_40_29]|nr:MAG: hypothetical protein A2622_05220 [Bdellovibrionales bacterium RIFCSPHIGHO2_01_FULL_40_29]OFZ34673.1 MAG: hypothetical protein A3D17_10155 [Bdellovibrionales bacterium RIFCSPHIGHO2_02_FULL_40_15]
MRNKYIVFAAIGFELIGLILASLWFGSWLEGKGYSGAQAICVVLGFLIWFISLIVKLRGLRND